MGSAKRTLGILFGAFAGLGGIEHGYFEFLQGSVRHADLIFPSMGPPCVPESAWHGCEPALSLIPNLLVSGVVSMVLGLATLVWSIFFLRRQHGGLVLMLLSVALLLTGGGIVPPVIGFFGGIAAMRAAAPSRARRRKATGLRGVGAHLWPWSLIAFFAFIAGMVAVGYFQNDTLKQYGLVVLVGLPLLMLVALASAWARDRTR